MQEATFLGPLGRGLGQWGEDGQCFICQQASTGVPWRWEAGQWEEYGKEMGRSTGRTDRQLA